MTRPTVIDIFEGASVVCAPSTDPIFVAGYMTMAARIAEVDLAEVATFTGESTDALRDYNSALLSAEGSGVIAAAIARRATRRARRAA